jgi:hypothetical protein
VGAQVCRWEPDLFAAIVAGHHSSKNRVLTAKHLRRLLQIACFHGFTNCRAAYQFAIDGHRGNSYDAEIEPCAMLFEQFEVAAPVSSKRPFVAYTDFAQRF